MLRSALSVAVIISTLLGLSTRTSAECLGCQECIYDPLPNNEGNACINYWTCSGQTITCYYPSAQDPGTFMACPFTMSNTDSVLATFKRSDTDPDGPTCAGTGIIINDECEPPNSPWDLATESCTAAEGYVGAPNSGLV